MALLTVLSDVSKVIEEIYTISSELLANRRRHERLVKRLEVLKPILSHAVEVPASVAQRLSEAAVKELLVVLRDAKSLIKRYANAKFYKRLFLTFNYKDEFETLNERLRVCIEALGLGYSVGSWADEDAADRREDTRHIRDYLETLVNENGASAEDLRDIRAGLSRANDWIHREIDALNDCQASMRREITRARESSESSMNCMLGFMERKMSVLEKQVSELRSSASTSRVVRTRVTMIRADRLTTSVKLIDNGGMGDVYEGEYIGQRVAIKRLPRSGECAENLRREAEILQMLRYPNIVQLIGLTEAEPCLVLEYAGGGSLYAKLHESGSSVAARDKLALALDVVSGLEYLHSHEPAVYHCDLTSRNILLCGQGRCKLCDFGLSRVNATSWANSRLGAGGTNAWIAPEVFTSDRVNDVDWERADVYALGVVLCEIQTRKPPWHGRHPSTISHEVTRGKRPTRPAGDEKIPVLFKAMECCWRDVPADRPRLADDATIRLELQRELAPPATAEEEDASPPAPQEATNNSVDYAAASAELARALSAVESSDAADPVETASMRHELANMYKASGRLDLAAPLYESAYATRLETFGPFDLSVGASLNDVGTLHFARGETDVAEKYICDALSIYENSLGPRHPFIAKILNNLALVSASRANIDKAQTMLARCIDINETAGSDLDLGCNYNNLGELLVAQGKDDDAADALEKALAHKLRAIARPETSPSVAVTLANLAVAIGPGLEAMNMLRCAKSIFAASLGADHRRTKAVEHFEADLRGRWVA